MESRTPARRRSTRLAVAALAAVTMLGLPLATRSASWAAESSAADAGASAAPTETTAAGDGGEPGALSEPIAAIGPAAPVDLAGEPAEPVPAEPEPGDALEPAPEPAPGDVLEPAPGDALEPAPQPSEPEPQPEPSEPDASEPSPGALEEPGRPSRAERDAAPSATEVVAPLATALVCRLGDVFAVAGNGALSYLVPTSNAYVVHPVVASIPAATGVDGLAIAPDASTAYAFQTSADGIANILVYRSGADAWESVPSSFVDGSSQRLVAGALNPADGRYYVGGFDLSGGRLLFRVSRVDVGSGAITGVGSFDTTLPDQLAVNGDMAFDGGGNLYVIRGTNRIDRFVVTAQELWAGGDLAVSVTPGSLTGQPQVANGLSFASSGAALVSNSTHLRDYDPTDWKKSSGNSPIGIGITDLAGCTSPTTLTLRKDVPRRVVASDEFRLIIGPAAAPLREATTQGPGVGLQAVEVGPVPVLAGTTVEIHERMGAGRAADYESSWRCTDGATGAGVSGSVIAAARSTVCTFTNAPLVTRVAVLALVQDERGANEAPAAGWTLSAAAAGTGVALAAGSPAQQSAGSDGRAYWDVRHPSSLQGAAITVAETQPRGYGIHSVQCIATSPTGVAGAPVTGSAESLLLADVPAGSTVDCVFVSRSRATDLTLRSAISFGDPSLVGEWTLTATPTESGALPGPTGATGVNASVTAGVGYTLTSAGGPAAYVDAGWSCSRDDGAAVPLAEGDVVTAGLGDNLACTLTQTTATLTLLKHIDGTVPGTIQPSDFTLTATPAAFPGLETATFPGSDAPVTVGPAANTFAVRPDHDYALAETSALAYIGVELQRYTAAYPVDGVFVESAWAPATVETVRVADGDHAVYRFVNLPVPVLTLPLTGGIGADAYLFGGGSLLSLAALVLLVQSRIRSSRLPGRLT